MNPRPLRAADAPAAAALIRACFTGLPVTPPSSAAGETTESVAAHIASQGGICHEAGGALVGLLLWTERASHTLYVGRLAVAPQARGQGVAKRLLAAAEAEARARGLDRLLLGVRVELTANHRLFASLGFHEIGRSCHEGFDQPTSIDMAKPLA